MTKVLPLLPEGTVICRVPTAPTRIRIRGYDQADLLARHISKSTGLSKMDLINRTSNSRQLGSSRRGRFINAKKSYEVINPSKVSGKNILLVDDVTTSGATLETIAELLKQAGAKNIDAVVYSQAID